MTSGAEIMTTKTLFMTRKWPPAVGGMETYSYRLCEELSCLIDIETLVLPGRADGRTPSVLALIWFGLRMSFVVPFKARHFDVIHAGDMALWPLALLGALFNSRARIVLSAHGTDVDYGDRSGLASAAYRHYLRLGARMLGKARIIANSNATRERLGTHGYIDAPVVPLGTDCDQHSDTPPLPYVLFAGRLIPRKGCGWFINNVLPQLPDHITLCVAGVISDVDEKAALDHPRVEFLGPVRGAALGELRRRALAVIVPNIDTGEACFEGFGLTAPEAAAAGGVTLVARLFGLTDAVIDGETGFLLEAGDAGAWADKINEIDNWDATQRQRFVEAARAKVRQYYSWSRVARDTLEIYTAKEMKALSPAEETALNAAE